MAQTLLAFELKPETDAAVRDICARLGIDKIDIAKKDYAQKLGCLAKVSGFAREKTAYNGDAFSAEMLVFSGMDSDQVDVFLAEYKQTGLPDIGLKAIVTMYNIFWSAEMLFHALMRELDFSEEDVEFADRTELCGIAEHIACLLGRLCDSFAVGNVLKNGVPVAIVGNTNVGKSTLLNALLHEERAIVSEVAGTTRDVIEDTVNLEGITFRFIDTAGIRTTEDRVESMGIERTFRKIAQAHIVLLVTDLKRGTEQFGEYYRQVKEHLAEGAKLMIVLNKTDEVEDVLTPQETIRLLTSGEEIVPISARTGRNVEGLVRKLTDAVQSTPLSPSDVIVSNVRHYEALKHALAAIRRVQDSLTAGISSEFVSQDTRECLHYLGEITGEITTEEVLGNVFRGFCVGK